MKQGEVIRHKTTGHPYLIVASNSTCLLIVDLELPIEPLPLFALLPRDYKKYARDVDMNCYTIKRYQYWLDIKNVFTLAPKIRLGV